MGQILHSCARTTKAVRKTIQDSKESIKCCLKDTQLIQKQLKNERKGIMFTTALWDHTSSFLTNLNYFFETQFENINPDSTKKITDSAKVKNVVSKINRIFKSIKAVKNVADLNHYLKTNAYDFFT